MTLAVFAIALVLSLLDAHAARLSTSLHLAHDELLKLALHDSLTRLPNRLLFADRLEQRIQECQHSQRSFSLLFLDLDGFKIINDAHGHHTGDLLLAEVAARITGLLGGSDTASRFGGDEFVLALAPGDLSQTTAFAERLLAALAQPYEWEHHSRHRGISPRPPPSPNVCWQPWPSPTSGSITACTSPPASASPSIPRMAPACTS
ncbi:putative diguanylate cyclase YedQ [compost metagenome]